MRITVDNANAACSEWTITFVVECLLSDSQCPWINNCVGHRTHAAFLRFLFFVDLSCGMHLWLISTSSFGSATYYANDQTTLWLVMLILNYTLCAPVIFAVGCFSIYHFYCLAVNMTTIESWEKDKVATLRRRGHVHDVRAAEYMNADAHRSSTRMTWACYETSAPYLGNALCSGAGRSLCSTTVYRTRLRVVSVSGSTHSRPRSECVRVARSRAELTAITDPIEQYFWPPRDETAAQDRSAMRRLQQSDARPFTYGQDLNPELRSRLAAADDDDDIPLAQLDGPRVRRGSEGLEIRPTSWRAEAVGAPPWRYDDGYASDDQPRYNVYSVDDQSSISSLESM